MSKSRFLAATASLVLSLSVIAGPTLAQSGGNPEITANSPIYAELNTKLDTKKAKVGETVTAKTIAQALMSDGKSAPQGSVLTGKVSAVQSESAGNGTASITIVFDQIRPGKHASPVAMHGVVVGIAPKPYLENSGASGADLPLASTRSQLNTPAVMGQNVDNSGGSGESVALGSSMRHVSLSSPTGNDAGMLSSHKDFKLNRGTRLAIEREAE